MEADPKGNGFVVVWNAEGKVSGGIDSEGVL